MAIVVTEKFESRRLTTGKNAALDLVYNVFGTEDELAAKNAVEAASPRSYGSPSQSPYVLRQNIQVEPVGTGLWTATVHYDTTGAEPTWALDSFEFDTSGGTQHVTQSLGTLGRYAASGWGCPDFQGAIGVSQNSVEGVDITVPVFNFAETHRFTSITDSYKLALFYATGKINNATFRGFAAGEVLFLGATGSKRDVYVETPWEITYRFAACRNRTNIVVGSIGGIAKRGWDYMWVRYAEHEDADALIKRPVGVYIERVYEDTNFAALGI